MKAGSVGLPSIGGGPFFVPLETVRNL